MHFQELKFREVMEVTGGFEIMNCKNKKNHLISGWGREASEKSEAKVLGILERCLWNTREWRYSGER